MIDFLDSISTFISQWLLDAAGWYGVLFVVVARFRKQWLAFVPDATVIKLISWAGIILTLNIILTTFIYLLTESNQEDIQIFTNRVFGPYWMYFWYQMLVWIICPQLFRLKPVQHKSILRLAASLPLAISLEEYIRFIVSFQRDFIHGLSRLFSLTAILETIVEVGVLILLARGFSKLKDYYLSGKK